MHLFTGELNSRKKTCPFSFATWYCLKWIFPTSTHTLKNIAKNTRMNLKRERYEKKHSSHHRSGDCYDRPCGSDSSDNELQAPSFEFHEDQFAQRFSCCSKTFRKGPCSKSFWCLV